MAHRRFVWILALGVATGVTALATEGVTYAAWGSAARPDASVAAATSDPGGGLLSALRSRSSSGRRPSTLEIATDLTMAITEVSPAGLAPGQPLKMSGTVTNDGTRAWTDAKVYLSIGSDPAVSKAALDFFATDDDGFGTTINDLGLFDEIGRLAPGSRTDWQLSIPFAKLPISGGDGVYQVGATLLAGNADGRDSLADARASTAVPYLSAGAATLNPTRVVTLLPITAPVMRHPDGVFVNDRLARLVSPGGRLRDVLDFASQAPAGSLELVVDPALRQGLVAMSQGYLVQSFAQAAQGVDTRAGLGRQDAAEWLHDLATLRLRQQTTMLPWGSPATSSLAAAGVPGVVDAAVVSSQRYAAANSLTQTVADWQSGGSTTRRGLAVSRLAGAALHVLSQGSLRGLTRGGASDYPPAQVTFDTRPGPLTAIVTRSDIGGQPFASTMTALQFRQGLMAEATVRALTENHATSVFAAPFNWDPGELSAQADLGAGFGFRSVAPESLAELAGRIPATYSGGLPLPGSQPQLSPETISAIKRLRDTGGVYTELLTDRRRVSVTFDQQFANAGSSAWRRQPARGDAATRELARTMAEQLALVTVTGPAFVAMSSSTGQFPLTVSNDLNAAVTVRISVHPLNQALAISPLQPLHLGPGQSRDINVESTADGSGVTQVRARLSTFSNRGFGRRFDFNVRATQIGVAIWVAMGIGLAALVGTAARRLYKRARGEGFKTRGESTA